jgi:thiol-disulfide isomerase/thioredoxin
VTRKGFCSKTIWLLCCASILESAAPVPRRAAELAFGIPGRETQLLSSCRGYVVCLEFIQTTCPHCQAASKLLSDWQNRYGVQGLKVFDVAINPNADLLADSFAKEFKTSFPVGWSTFPTMLQFMGFELRERTVVPQLVLIDRSGNIRYQTPASGDDYNVMMNPERIEKQIQALLAEPKHETKPTIH